ncbi:MAG: type I polyketide synthase, partial [Deltaproteobacteria bacterium]|nr:type I polyketide synthase [Deltaproteobacteria bacterium]
MEARFGKLESLRAFQEAVFNGVSAVGARPAERWRGIKVAEEFPGAYLDSLAVEPGEFRIPPNEIAQLLPQQLLMLQVAKNALDDAGLLAKGRRETRLRAGVVVGMSLDLNTTNFDLRWSLNERDERRDAVAPALNATRTLGALGGMIASRIARELDFGGPCFTLSSEESSGLRAVEVAVRNLQDRKLDLVVSGAVDVTGDPRAVLAGDMLSAYAQTAARPFDSSACGANPGEGAAAVVLKRLEDAQRDGDRIYAVIRGLGSASAGNYAHALERGYQDAAVEAASISYVEANASGNAELDALEAQALVEFRAAEVSGEGPTCALGSAKAVIGDAGAAAGLAGLVKTCLCLFHEILPPLPGFQSPRAELAARANPFHVPQRPLPWLRDRAKGPRRAGVSAMGADGSCLHAVLEGVERAPADCAVERNQPLGSRPEALFAVTAADQQGLSAALAELEAHSRRNEKLAVEALARSWFALGHSDGKHALAVAIVASDVATVTSRAREAHTALASAPGRALDGRAGVYYSPEPQGLRGEMAFVYPGSGNHFIGMGTGMALEWPHVLREQDSQSQHLASNFMPHWHAPYRLSWQSWESEAAAAVVSDQHRMIFGQVTHGVLVTDVLRSLGVHPKAALGYSLGESTSLFSLRAWRDRDEMLRRMLASPLFVNELAGRCDSARKLLDVAGNDKFEWKVALVNRSAREVTAALSQSKQKVFLLIVNAPDECVLGGEQRDVDAFVSALGAQAWRIEGVSTVHCAVVDGVEKAYRDLHVHVTTPPEGIRFYSGNKGRSYEVNAQSAADSVIAHATRGFDYPKLINQAYEDGIRVFVEIGPQTSCTRAISKTLAGRPHVAIGASVRGQEDRASILKVLARLLAERVPVDLAALYGRQSLAVGHQAVKARSAGAILVPIELGRVGAAAKVAGVETRQSALFTVPVSASVPAPITVPVPQSAGLSTYPQSGGLLAMAAATAEAHGAYLATAAHSAELLAQNLSFQARVEHAIKTGEWIAPAPINQYQDSSTVAGTGSVTESGTVHGSPVTGHSSPAPGPLPAYNREQCLEFAKGTIAKALGESFADIDKFPTRVRLPDEPLMLVDRIVSVRGEAQSLKGGGCITEHDVKPGAWYLDGNRMPVCITVEAGQADLFLSAYLGIDRETRGERRYRLLDAKITFHRALPSPGETVRYEIEIDRFIKQGSTYLFFFRFEGFIGQTSLLTMSDGCAGF